MNKTKQIELKVINFMKKAKIRQVVDELMLTPEGRNVIPFVGHFNFVAPFDLEEILEYLNDQGYLSANGAKFRDLLWATFIKVDK